MQGLTGLQVDLSEASLQGVTDPHIYRICRTRALSLPIPLPIPLSNVEKLQWNLSNPDALGTEKSVLIGEVS